jgi:biotin carboxylase
MNTSPILLIAGGTYQLALIDAARRRGLKTVVFDGDPLAPGLARADRGQVVDLTDLEAVKRAACEVKPCAVAAIVSEVAVRAVAEAAAALGLPGLPRAVAEACTDKFLMRRCFAAAGLPVPQFRKAQSVQDALTAAGEIGYPVVIKPVDSSGSRGVRRVDDPGAMPSAVDLALSQSQKREAIVERFVAGIECTVETFSYHGRTEILGISEKVHVPFPACVSIDLTYPPSFAQDTIDAIADAARAAIAAVGLTSGPGHVEVFVTPDGPLVVELAARGGGYRIFSDIVPALSGVDPVECVLDLALGQEPRFDPTRAGAAVLRFFNPAARGVLQRVTGVEEARALKGILDVVIELPVGAPYDGITRDSERPGYVIAVGVDRATAVARATAVERTVQFEFAGASLP